MSEEPIEHDVVRGPPKNLATGLVKAVRPRQWVKNVLVLAAPVAAGAVDEPDILGRTAIAFVAFCLVASCIYLVNDALDVEADRNHPTKRFRPIAAGVVPVNLAFVLAIVLGVASIAISFLANWQLAVVIGIYMAIQLAYCRPQTRTRHRHLHRLVGLSAPCGRGWRGRRSPQRSVQVVPAGDDLRFAVHGGR